MNLTTWQWVGVSAWSFFGVVGVTMLRQPYKLSPLVRGALFLFQVVLLAWLGPFLFALAMDHAEER